MTIDVSQMPDFKLVVPNRGTITDNKGRELYPATVHTFDPVTNSFVEGAQVFLVREEPDDPEPDIVVGP